MEDIFGYRQWISMKNTFLESLWVTLWVIKIYISNAHAKLIDSKIWEILGWTENFKYWTPELILKKNNDVRTLKIKKKCK